MSIFFWRKIKKPEPEPVPQQILLEELEKSCEAKKQEIAALDCTLATINKNIDDSTAELNRLKEEIVKAKDELDLNEGRVLLDTLGIQYIPARFTPAGIEFKIMNAKDRMAHAVKQKTYYTTSRQFTVDGSASKGKKFVEAFCENNILGFNLYCEKKRKSITTDNYSATMQLIENAFTRYSKRLSIISAQFTPEYLGMAKNWVKLELDLKTAKAREKERIRKEKRKLREEQQLLAEAEKERKRLEEERKAMDIAFNKALTEAERKEIKQKLAQIDKRIADVDYRVNNPKAGWVYIIHSDSLKDMIKIGTSRRLSGPHERVKELSGSSLPTPFMIDAFCFSDDAFALESNLHKYFDKQRINPNKEFFRVTAKEAIEAMENVFGHKAHIVNLEDNDNDNEID